MKKRERNDSAVCVCRQEMEKWEVLVVYERVQSSVRGIHRTAVNVSISRIFHEISCSTSWPSHCLPAMRSAHLLHPKAKKQKHSHPKRPLILITRPSLIPRILRLRKTLHSRITPIQPRFIPHPIREPPTRPPRRQIQNQKELLIKRRTSHTPLLLPNITHHHLRVAAIVRCRGVRPTIEERFPGTGGTGPEEVRVKLLNRTLPKIANIPLVSKCTRQRGSISSFGLKKLRNQKCSSFVVLRHIIRAQSNRCTLASLMPDHRCIYFYHTSSLPHLYISITKAANPVWPLCDMDDLDDMDDWSGDLCDAGWCWMADGV